MEPKIRLKGFCGEWKSTPFLETFDYIKNNSLSRDMLSQEGEVQNIHYGDVLIKYGECVDSNKDDIPFVKDKETAKVFLRTGALQNGDVVIADAAEDNSVGKCSEIVCDSMAQIVSGLHTIPVRPKSEFASRYLGYYMNSPAYHNQLLPHIQGTKISSISKKAVACTNIIHPASKDEQRALATFFTSLDNQISAAEKRLASLKQVKAASLQAMFPQEGETTPKLRFKGCEGEWKKVKLGDVALVNPKSELPESFEYVDLESVIGTSMIAHRRETKGSAPSRAQRLAQTDDIFYQTVRPYQRNNYHFMKNESDYVFSSGYAQLRSIKDANFLFTIIQSDFFLKQVMDNCTGSSFPAINPSSLKELIVHDCDRNEQKLIGDFFTSLDRQITAQSSKISKLKQIKSACLDQMFV